jgi:hypothetical protein
MRLFALITWTLMASAAWAEEPAPSAKAAEEEVVDLDALDADEKGAAPTKVALTARVPEHEYDQRLLALPALLVLILVWNVNWRPPSKAKAKA